MSTTDHRPLPNAVDSTETYEPPDNQSSKWLNGNPLSHAMQHQVGTNEDFGTLCGNTFTVYNMGLTTSERWILYHLIDAPLPTHSTTYSCCHSVESAVTAHNGSSPTQRDTVLTDINRGNCLSTVPDKTISCLDRFKRIEYVRQHFWQRFSNEYVSSLQQKTKWSVASDRKLREGTLVLIREKALPPLVWALGRVVRTYAGVDGITRVADVKTKRGVITRGFNNICPLPFEDVNRREDVHASTA
ncbi:hypothetical protein SFRURICE_002586 [Spodoptera frugiperda]|nr:hypothetical protein SFRURICE_002586 [Spodoptera frugiperda]